MPQNGAFRGYQKNILGTSASLTTAAAAGAYTALPIIEVPDGVRRCTLWVAYNAAAIGGLPSILASISAIKPQPGPTEDAWFIPGVWDGSVSGAALTAASLPAGTDYTVTPNFGGATQQALNIKFNAAVGATDKLRVRISIDVSDAKWLQLLYAEAGVVGTPGALWLSYSFGTG